jgi:hypothetical protein
MLDRLGSGSWVSQEEVEMLKREQREEAERQRRGMATTTVKVSTSLAVAEGT